MLQFLSLFSGIGAFEKALDRLGVEYNLVNYCEIDKYASKSYAAIHNVSELLNLGDITKVDTSKLPPVDVVSYGFPCQDISLAGKQKGLFNEDGELTRSGLFFEALRIIEDAKPKVAIAENVKNLTSKKFAEQFKIVLDSLETAGYNNYWQVLNAKDYGVPQNRERVFIVSIRKDIDTGAFKFPEPFELKLRLKDLLEPEVDEKYYLSKDIQDRFKITDETFSKSVVGTTIGDECTRFGQRDLVYQQNAIMGTLNATDYKQPKQVLQIGNCCPTKTRDNPNQGRIYDTEGLSPALNCMGGGNRQPCVPVKENTMPVCLNSKGGRGGVEGLQPSVQDRVYDSEAISTAVTTSYMPSIAVRENTKKGYAEANEGDSINFEQPNSKTRRGRVGKQVAQTLTTSPQQGCVVKNKGQEYVRNTDIAGTLMARDYKGLPNYEATAVTNGLRIRKLTPLECFRLMGFDDEDYCKAEKVNSNSQLYKQAGNSIVVDVLEYLFKEILEVVDMKRADDKVVVYECDDLINLEALKEKEPELYDELLTDYPCEDGTYIFKHKNF